MLLVQGEEEGWTPRWNETDDGVVGGRGLPIVWAPRHLPVQPSVFCCYWCSRQHIDVPKPLDVVSRRNYLTALRLWIFSFCHNYSAPYDTAWEFHLDTFLSSPQTSVWTSEIRRGILRARRFPLGDCSMLDICLQIHQVQFRTNLAVNHCDFSQMDGWTNI